MARRSGEQDQVEGQDEEFLFHLDRGSDLLARGDAAGARGALEKALELRARDPKVLGLLGQACYRLGKYEDAIIAWQRLVDESPAEAAARVNLGLAFLRAGRQSQAIRQLEIALDLNPDHKKAMGYLGLALLESGDPLRAREWFVRAGSDQMVARCDEALGGARAGEGEDGQEGEGEDGLPSELEGLAAAVVEDAGGMAGVATIGAEDVGISLDTPAHADPAVILPPLERHDEATRGTDMNPLALSPSAPASGPRSGQAEAKGELPDLSAYTASIALPIPPAAPFAVAPGVVAVHVPPAVRVRLAGLLAVQGAVEADPEVKRFRGRPTEKPFGFAAARFHRVHGEGTLLFAPGERRFTALALAEPAFVREEALFALTDDLAFENGRVPSDGAEELNLVHLRGRGAVLLATAGAPRALEVHPEAPLRLPLAALVGWIGAVTPRVVALVDGGPAELVGVELSGDGRVLVDPGAGGDGEPT